MPNLGPNSQRTAAHANSSEYTSTRMEKGRSPESLVQPVDNITGKMLRRSLAAGRKLHVCVVGAGFAGLRAADVLLAHGAKVTMLESRNRIGGRVAQSTEIGPNLDLGANWIHGDASGNPIMELAKKTNTSLHTWPERQVVYGPDGNPLPSSVVAETSEVFWSILGDAFAYSNKHSETISADRSLFEYIKEKADERYGHENDGQSAYMKDLLLKNSHLFGGFVAGSVETQSLKFFWLEECIDGENPFVAGTYQKILGIISKPAKAKARILLEHKVASIESAENQVQIETENGFAESFDEVIVTLPLGVLKQRREIFKPALPLRLSQAIDNIGYGRLDKIYITFPSAFWMALSASPSPAPATTHAHPVPNTKSPTQHPTTSSSSSSSTTVADDLDDNTFPGFADWLHPLYAPSNPNHWHFQCINLASLPPGEAHPTLLFYVFGSCAAHIATLAHHEIIPFFKPYLSLLPHYSADSTACQPTGALATAWSRDEHAGYGSYSNFCVGVQAADEDLRVMRRGVPERRLWLAGEHVAPFEATGTTTGAFWAGEGAALGILRVYGLADEGGDKEE